MLLAVAALALALSDGATPAAPAAPEPQGALALAAPTLTPPAAQIDTAQVETARIEAGRASSAREPDEEASEPGKEPPLQLSMEGLAGSRGEQGLQLLARWQGEQLALGLGAETSSGPWAALRHGLIAQGELSLGEAALRGEIRARPTQAGSSRLGAEVGVRVEGAAGSVDLALRGTTLSAERTAFVGGTGGAALASVEGTAELEGAVSTALSLGLRLAGTAADLRWQGRAPPKPWEALGNAALEWPGRWEAAATARIHGGGAQLSLAAGAGAPAAPGVSSAGAQVRLEVEAGRTTLGLFFAGARQWPGDLWLGEAGFAAALRVGGDPAR